MSEPSTVQDLLSTNCYPGRLVLLSRTGDGSLTAILLVTGRSAASKDRSIVPGRGGEILAEVVPSDADAAHDDLRHYAAAVHRGPWFVLGNGDHVGPVAAGLHEHGLDAPALAMLEYEPDPPICTPRIGVAVCDGSAEAWFFSAQRDESSDATRLGLWRVAGVPAGHAYAVSTYVSDGEHVATNRSLAALATSAATPEQLLDEIWAAETRFRVAATAISVVDRPARVLIRP